MALSTRIIRDYEVDTVEEINGTYFFAGRSNLTTSELFFMVFVFNTADQFGIKDVASVYALYAGINDQATRAKPGTAILEHPDYRKVPDEYLAIECSHLG